MKENINIPAIHDDDLKKMLQNYGILNQFESGHIKCLFCDNIVTWDNIYGVILIDDAPKLICDSVDCVDKINNKENG